MLVALLVGAAIVGAMIGSFLNVIIARVPLGESIVRPRSHCPHCDQPIRPQHNIPVLSYAMLRGRCADCRAPISIRYPLVELVTAALFVGAALFADYQDMWALLPALWYFVSVGLALALIDVSVHRLPNVIVLPSYLVMAALLTVAATLSGDWAALGRAAIGAAALFGFYLLLLLIYPAGMGWGDVKLAGVLGGLTAYVSWSALLVGTFAGFGLGAVVAVVVLATGRGTGKTALPFGPFMLLGAAIGLTVGRGVAALYLGVVGA